MKDSTNIATVRTDYLSGDVTPELTATLRQLRLEFKNGDGDPLPLVYNTYNVIDAATYASDDKEGRYVWGDSCVNVDYILRLVNKAVWGDTANYLVSFTKSGADAADWAYVDVTDSATTPTANTRPGVYPGTNGASTRVFCVWYVSSGSVYRELLTYNTGTGVWSWSSKTAGVSLATPGFDACAIHPVSASEAFVVGYQDHYLWVRYLKYDGGWTLSGSAWTVWDAGGMDQYDAFFSDAVLVGSTYLLTINLGSHGAGYALTYDVTMDSYSQPYPILGATHDDTALRSFPMGLEVYNSRAWLVQYRAMEGGNGSPYAYHMALASTTDGRYWRDEGFIGSHYCTGKLLYIASATYCYVAGNAIVYRALASNKIGYDNASLKKVITEATSWRVTCPGAGSAVTVESNLLNHGAALSASDLLRADNQFVLELGSGGTDATVYTGYFAGMKRDERFDSDRYSIATRGPLYFLTGPGAYHPPMGKMYESPQAWYTNFNTDTWGQRQSLATIEGVWTCTKPADRARWCMKAEATDRETPGIAIVPRSISYPWLTCVTHFKCLKSVEGAFIVFYYEDDENYWRAGLRNVSGTVKLVIDRVDAGVVTNKANSTYAAAIDTWYSLYLDLKPGTVRAYFKASETDDFSSADASVSYAVTSEADAPPLPHHIGLSVMERVDATDADDYGTVTKAFAKQMQDSTKDFTSTVLGKYVWVNNDWRQVVDYTVVEDDDGNLIALTVDTAWSTIPSVGDAWGLYTVEGSAYAIFADLYWSDGCPLWSKDDIVDDVLESSGVGRTGIYTGNIDSLTLYKDLHVAITGDAAPSVIFHASTTDTYTGWKIALDDSYHYLYYTHNGGSSWRTLRKYPNLFTVDISDQPEVIVSISGDNAFIYASGHYVGSFMSMGTPGYGYCIKGGAGTYTLQEFGVVQDALMWSTEEEPNAILARLLRGRFAKLVERYDGSVSISEYETRDDLGTWATTVRRRGNTTAPVPSLIEVLGAEQRAYYIEPETAMRGLRFRRADNPAVITEAETLEEARRLSSRERELASGGEVELHAPDPAVEPEDTVTVNSVDYIVDGYGYTLAYNAKTITAGMVVNLRTAVAPVYAGQWGVSNWGEFKYGTELEPGPDGGFDFSDADNSMWWAVI